jgi:hypothetical protein
MKNQSWYVYALLGLLLGGLVYIIFFKPRQAELNAARRPASGPAEERSRRTT